MTESASGGTSDTLSGQSQLPLVTLKWAQTIDGRIATGSGNSRWVSGPESRRIAHRLRAEHDAILVGIGTVLADDPRLTVRLSSGQDPVRVVLDSSCRIPLQAKVLLEDPRRAIVATTDRAHPERRQLLRRSGVRVLEIPEDADGSVDLRALLSELARAGIRSVLVEGGSAVTTSFLRQELGDRIVVFIAPKILGAGTDAVGSLGITAMDDALWISDEVIELAGKDIVVQGRLTRGQLSSPQ